jgi:hypothetical protein
MLKSLVFKKHLNMHAIGKGGSRSMVSEVPEQTQQELWGKTFPGEAVYTGTNIWVKRLVNEPLLFVDMRDFLEISLPKRVPPKERERAKRFSTLCECVVISRK